MHQGEAAQPVWWVHAVRHHVCWDAGAPRVLGQRPHLEVTGFVDVLIGGGQLADLAGVGGGL